MCYQHRSPSLPATQKQQINDIFSVDVVFFKSLSWKQSSRRCRAACSPPECAILLPRLGLQSALGEIPVESFPAVFPFRGDTLQIQSNMCVGFGCLLSP